jgi:hypothetical protein
MTPRVSFLFFLLFRPRERVEDSENTKNTFLKNVLLFGKSVIFKISRQMFYTAKMLNG